MSTTLRLEVLAVVLARLLAAFEADKFAVVDFKTCGGEAMEVRVNPCEKLPCPFKKGHSVKIEMDFNSSKNHTVVSVGIMGKAAGVLFPLPFNQKDGCTGSGLRCPLVSGHNYTVSRAIRVYRIYPKIEILAVFEVKGNDEEVLACVQFPVHIL